jgi:hypothetical protein
MRVIEWPGRLTVLTEEADCLYELRIAVSDRRHLLPPSVAELDHD